MATQNKTKKRNEEKGIEVREKLNIDNVVEETISQ
jgi:hypothetical protein